MKKKKVTEAELEFLDNAAFRIVANGSHFPEHAYNHAERLLEERKRRYEIENPVGNLIVRHNLMKDKNYTPYCGGDNCEGLKRTIFNGQQFSCDCGWISEFPEDFIKHYKEKYNL